MGRARYAFEGCYEANRAAALSGVPVSTIYDWARKGVIVPSVSPVRQKLWSYADLMGLRVVYWLRHPKGEVGEVPASPMSEVRRQLEELDARGLDLWQGSLLGSPLRVDRSGHVFVVAEERVTDAHGRAALGADFLELLAPFEVSGARGPDLIRPRPHLRIVPGKCSGEPHLDGSRLTTPAVAALARRGYGLADIARLYPDEDPQGLADSIDLEDQLAANLRLAA